MRNGGGGVGRCVYGYLLLLLLLSACGNSRTAAIPTPTPSIPQPTGTPVTDSIFVDLNRPVAPINPLVYGTNYGPWLAVPAKATEEFANSGLKFLRFPGGRWGDSNNITERQVDLLMQYAETLDAEVTISVRLLGGTPEAAAELVRYVNIEQGYNVRYWSIGNEPSLYATLQNSPEWDTAHYNVEWRKFAEAMLAVDETIELLGPNTHQFLADPNANPKDDKGIDWMRAFLEANGDMVDVVTFHRYPFPQSRTDPMPEISELRANSSEWDDIVPAIRELIVETVGEPRPIGVMEINANYTNVAGGEATPDSHYGAIWWGDVLGRMINQQVDMVTHFALQHHTSGWGMFARSRPRPAYYVYQLYQRMGDTLLHSSSHLDTVSVVATRDEEGAASILLINLADDLQQVPLRIDGWSGGEDATIYRFDQAHMAEEIEAWPITALNRFNIPGQSMTLIVLPNAVPAK